MAYDRFMIAPFNTGLQTDLKPWLIMEDAFTQLQNAYVFRGRITKRFGGKLIGLTPQLSRFRIPLTGGAGIGITDGAGNAAGIVPGAIFQVGQMFSIGAQLYTVITVGLAATLNTGGGAATYNTVNGAYTFNGAPPVTQIYFYPADPVMGLTNYEKGPINNQPSYGFDTQFAYVFAGGFWARSGTGVTPIWHGTNIQFFWVENWKGLTADSVVMFVTNFNATVPVPAVTDDPIWTFDGANWVARTAPGPNGIYFRPAPGNPPVPIPRYTGPYIKTSRLIIAFKDRLLLLNTIENDNPAGDGSAGTNTTYPQRCRYSHNGSPFAQNAWYEANQSDSSATPLGLSNADGAGFIDATTDEQIVSAQFIKDRLIVYFERSTWELVYTGNEVLPFRWQKINTELGSVATFSSVPFDKVILTIGNTGVHACTGANVERIDTKIPDEIFEFDIEEIDRVAGVRDFFTELVYWSFTGTNESAIGIFPNQILVYNYRNDSWALNDDCITSFGYFEQQADVTWANAGLTWAQYNATWVSGVLQAQFRQILAGNQQGYTFLISPDISRNAPVMQITNMVININNTITLTIINHTLNQGDFIAIENAQGVTNLNVTYNNVNPELSFGIYKILSVAVNSVIIRLNNIQIVTGVYTGGGNATRVSNLGITSKQWNPYVNKGRDVYLAKINFGVETTSKGQVVVDYFPSSTETSMINAATATNSILGNSILETFPYPSVPLEMDQARLWHPVYFQTDGECIQINISMNDTQMGNPFIAWEEFVLEGLILFTQPTSFRLQ